MQMHNRTAIFQREVTQELRIGISPMRFAFHVLVLVVSDK